MPAEAATLCSGAANGVAQDARAPSEMTLQTYNLTHNRMQCHTHTFTAHLFTLNGLKQTQNNCPVCYSLSRDQKPFNTKVRRDGAFTSKCTRPETVWWPGSARTRWGAYNAPS